MLELGKTGLCIGTGQEEKRVHDPSEMLRLFMNGFQGTLQLGGGAFAAQGDLDLSQDRGQGSPQLVRGVAREAALPRKRFL